jgi:hypothetical protein
VKSKKSRESGLIYCESPSNSVYDIWAKVGNGREQVGNNGCPPKRYLASREGIAHKSCGHD